MRVTRKSFGMGVLLAAVVLSLVALIIFAVSSLGWNTESVTGQDYDALPYESEYVNNVAAINTAHPDEMVYTSPAPCVFLTYRQEYISTITANPPSQIIIPASEIRVSRTIIAFVFHNRSDEGFTYDASWLLARYADSIWQPVPYKGGMIVGWHLWQRSIAMGESIFEMKDIYSLYGELPPGRYMYIRRITPILLAGRTPEDREYLQFEFIIDETTPLSLAGGYVSWLDRHYPYRRSVLPLPQYIQVINYSYSQAKIELTISNTSSHNFVYLAPGTLRRYHHGHWGGIRITTDITPYSKPFPPGSTITITADLQDRYGLLRPAKYQFILNFYVSGLHASEMGHKHEFEFTITADTPP